MNETAQRLMDLAEAHIRHAGYRGFSFRDLAAELGIKSASVHHHFPTKASLAAAVVRRYGDRFLATVASRPNETGDDAISAYRSAFRKALARDGRMCLCGVLGAEAGVLTPEVVEEIQSFFRRCIDDLTQRIGGPEAEARAFHVMATLEGGMMCLPGYRGFRPSGCQPHITAARAHPSTGHIEALCEPIRDRKSISFAYYRGGLAALRRGPAGVVRSIF